MKLCLVLNNKLFNVGFRSFECAFSDLKTILSDEIIQPMVDFRILRVRSSSQACTFTSFAASERRVHFETAMLKNCALYGQKICKKPQTQFCHSKISHQQRKCESHFTEEAKSVTGKVQIIIELFVVRKFRFLDC